MHLHVQPESLFRGGCSIFVIVGEAIIESRRHTSDDVVQDKLILVLSQFDPLLEGLMLIRLCCAIPRVTV